MRRKDNKVRVPELINNKENITEDSATIIEDNQNSLVQQDSEDIDTLDVPPVKDKKLKDFEKKAKLHKNEVPSYKLNLESKSAAFKPSSSNKGTGLVVGAVIFVVLILGLTLFYSGGIKEKLQSPLLINGQPVDSAEFSFMYHYILIDNGVDIFAAETPELLQEPSEDPNFATQREFFLNLTAQQMQMTTILYNDATSHGYEIQPEHYSLARAYIGWLSGKASEIGVSLDTYIKGVYGSQVNEQVVVSVLAKQYFVEDYASGAKLEELQASSEQAETAYQGNRNAYDTVNYKILRITYEQRDEAFVNTANLHATQIVEEINHDPSMFESVAAQYFSGEAANVLAADNSTLVSDARYDDFTHTEFRDWLFDFDRTPGDANIFTDSNGFPIIICFVSRDRQSVPLRDIRFVHISTDLYGNGEGYSMSEAQLIAQTIYDGINDETDIQSVESYYTDAILQGNIEVVHSSDTYPSKYSTVLSNWIFADERVPGDKAFIETGDGYYVVYMVSISENPEWYDRVNSFIRMQNYQAFINEMQTEYNYEFVQRGLDAIADVP